MKIAKRAALEVKNGMNVNLGIGIPTLLPEALPLGVKINLHSENGTIGVGQYPDIKNVNPNNINAGKVIFILNLGNYHHKSRRIIFFFVKIFRHYQRRSFGYHNVGSIIS
jgi:acyl CoA:acetate/3-ketoacid CoA transferase beta subunit